MAQTARDDAAQSNVTDDTISKGFREYEESVDKLETQKARHRNLVKRLKSYGIDTDTLKTVVAIKRRDPDDVLGEQRNFVRYCRVMALPIGQQLTLLNDDLPEVDVSAQEREQQEAWDCGEQGLRAGKNKEPASNNPYTPGQLNHAAWAEGHKRGAALAEEGLVHKRGRPKKTTEGEQQDAA